MQLAWAGPAQTESLAGRRPCDCCALHAGLAGLSAQREAASCRGLRRSASRPRGSARTFQDERKRTTLSSWGRWRCLLGIPRLPAVTQVCSFRRNLAVATKSSLHLGAWPIVAHWRADLGWHDAGLDWAVPDVDHANVNRGRPSWRCQHSWPPGHMVIRGSAASVAPSPLAVRGRRGEARGGRPLCSGPLSFVAMFDC